MSSWAAIEQALATSRSTLNGLLGALLTLKPHLDTPYADDPRWTPWNRFVERELRRLDKAKDQIKEALAAVGEAKRRESELERERDDLQRKIDGYFLSSEFAWWVEKAEKAEARAAEHLKAHDEIDLRWRRAEARVAELERALEYAERWIEHPNYRRIGRARREATGE